jgi:acetyl-CoA carboxylase alpha subunit
MKAVSEAIAAALESLSLMDGLTLKKGRRDKFLAMGKTGLS